MATPLSVTSVRLITNALLDSNYKHTRWFTSIVDQTNHFMTRSQVFEADDFNVLRLDGNTFTMDVPHSMEHLKSVSYCMFKNQLKQYYAFVIKKQNIQKNMTRLTMKVDVIQTYMFDMTFKTSYIEREHTRLFETNGYPVINTLDEGLNYGTDYDVVSVNKLDITNGLKWLVIVSKQAIHEDPITQQPYNKIISSVIGGVPQALSYYLIPFRGTNEGVNISNYGIPISDPTDALNGVYTYPNAVNNIVSIYVTDHCGLSYSYSGGNSMVLFNSDTDIQPATIYNYGGTGTIRALYVSALRSFDSKSATFNVYSGASLTGESKLLMNPYFKSVVTDMSGNQIELKPEYFNNVTAEVILKGSLGLTNKVSYSFQFYNNSVGGPETYEISDREGILNVDANDLPIVTDLLSAYIQGNKNSIANSKAQASFNVGISAVSGVTGVIGAGRNPLGIANAVTEGVANTGNALFDLQAINAKIKDIDNTPPNLATQGSNLYYRFGNNQNGLYIINYRIKPEYINTLSSFFKMFGYKVNTLKVPQMRTRQNYNYIKMVEANIFCDVDNVTLNEIRAIFTNGITLWHNNDIGNYNLANGVI